MQVRSDESSPVKFAIGVSTLLGAGAAAGPSEQRAGIGHRDFAGVDLAFFQSSRYYGILW